MSNICQTCGMVVRTPTEYHPYAACLMFKACHDGDMVRSNLDAVRATPAPGAPAGFKTVPVEPDGKMWSVGRAEFIRWAQNYEDARSAEKASIIGDIAGSDIFRAMVRAAPGAPGQEAAAILATFAHEILMGAIRPAERIKAARTALERAGMLSLETVVAASASKEEAAAVQAEPIAWESTTEAFKRFLTDRLYQKSSAAVKRWYKPYRCSSCTASAPDTRDAEIKRLNAIINTPQADDFLRAVSTEAEHQRQRWGSSHDGGKTPADWFWLVGYLAGKALHAHAAGNAEKTEHHIITTGAACANWHLALFGKTDMRPGHEEGIDAALPPSGAGEKTS